MRRNLKASLELNDYRYISNPIDENIRVVWFINYEEFNKFSYFKEKKFITATSLFFADSEEKGKLLYKIKDKETGKEYFDIKLNSIKQINEYDYVFVPCEEAKKFLISRGIASKILTMDIPLKQTKLDIKGTQNSKLVYIYFHLEENTKYFYTLLDADDFEAAKRIREFAETFNDYKIIVVSKDILKNRMMKKIFKKSPTNLVFTNIVGEDIYASLVYNSCGYLALSSYYGQTIELSEAMCIGKPIFALSTNSFKDILIDKETAYVYNNFAQLIDGVTAFNSNKLPSIKDKQIEFSKKNSVKVVGKEIIDLYKKIIEV